jgi:hypothetical protein
MGLTGLTGDWKNQSIGSGDAAVASKVTRIDPTTKGSSFASGPAP